MMRLLLCVLCLGGAAIVCGNDVFRPRQDQLPVPAPEGAIVLFDGDTNEFLGMDGGTINWPIEEGALVSTSKGANTNHVVARVHFRDADIHAEFLLPSKGKGNSGLYLHGNYELQILNSFGKEDYGKEDAGALYGFFPPLVNACRPPGEWQVYDIRYRAPRRDEQGEIETEGSLTAWLNGKKVQDNVRFGEPRSVYHPFRYGTTPYLREIWKEQKKTSVGSLFLQDHGNPVRFRNIWIRPLDDLARVYHGAKEASARD